LLFSFLVFQSYLNFSGLFDYFFYEKNVRKSQSLGIINFAEYFKLNNELICFNNFENQNSDFLWENLFFQYILIDFDSGLINTNCLKNKNDFNWIIVKNGLLENNKLNNEFYIFHRIKDSELVILGRKTCSVCNKIVFDDFLNLKYKIENIQFFNDDSIIMSVSSLDKRIWDYSSSYENFNYSVKFAIKKFDDSLNEQLFRCELPHTIYPGQHFKISCKIETSMLKTCKINIDLIKENYEWSHNINNYFYIIDLCSKKIFITN